MKSTSQVKSSTTSKKLASSMAELMSKHGDTIHTLKKGSIIQGTVKKLTPSEILLDIGAKSDALVIEFDKKNLSNLLSLLKVGDKVSASVISAESEEGFPVVSLRRMLDELLYTRLKDSVSSDSSVMVTLLEPTRGGYFAETSEGIRGFLPNSQLLTEGDLSNKQLEVKIIEADAVKKRVIFSEKAKTYISSPSDIGKYVSKNKVVEGVVTFVSSHGIYVSIQVSQDQMIEGFVHISEVSYARIEDLRSMFKKGELIKALAIDIDTENRRVNLSIKRLTAETLDSLKEKYPIDQKIKGTVVNVRSRGVIVKVDEVVQGFIPVSSIPSDVSYKKDEVVDAQVTGYDEKTRMVLLTPVLTTKFVGYR